MNFANGWNGNFNPSQPNFHQPPYHFFQPLPFVHSHAMFSPEPGQWTCVVRAAPGAQAPTDPISVPVTAGGRQDAGIDNIDFTEETIVNNSEEIAWDPYGNLARAAALLEAEKEAAARNKKTNKKRRGGRGGGATGRDDGDDDDDGSGGGPSSGSRDTAGRDSSGSHSNPQSTPSRIAPTQLFPSPGVDTCASCAIELGQRETGQFCMEWFPCTVCKHFLCTICWHNSKQNGPDPTHCGPTGTKCAFPPKPPQRKCTRCGDLGHNVRTCKQLAQRAVGFRLPALSVPRASSDNAVDTEATNAAMGKRKSKHLTAAALSLGVYAPALLPHADRGGAVNQTRRLAISVQHALPAESQASQAPAEGPGVPKPSRSRRAPRGAPAKSKPGQGGSRQTGPRIADNSITGQGGSDRAPATSQQSAEPAGQGGSRQVGSDMRADNTGQGGPLDTAEQQRVFGDGLESCAACAEELPVDGVLLVAYKCGHRLCERCHTALDTAGNNPADHAYCGMQGTARFCLLPATECTDESFASHRFQQLQDSLRLGDELEDNEDWRTLAEEEDASIREANEAYVDPGTLPDAPAMPTIEVVDNADEGTAFQIVLGAEVLLSWTETEDCDETEAYYNRLFRIQRTNTLALSIALSRRDALPEYVRERLKILADAFPADIRTVSAAAASVPLPPAEAHDPHSNSQRVRPNSAALLAAAPRRQLVNKASADRLQELEAHYKGVADTRQESLRSAAERELNNFLNVAPQPLRSRADIATRLGRRSADATDARQESGPIQGGSGQGGSGQGGSGQGGATEDERPSSDNINKPQVIMDNILKLVRSTAGKQSTAKTYQPAQKRFIDWCDIRAKWCHLEGTDPRVSDLPIHGPLGPIGSAESATLRRSAASTLTKLRPH